MIFSTATKTHDYELYKKGERIAKTIKEMAYMYDLSGYCKEGRVVHMTKKEVEALAEYSAVVHLVPSYGFYGGFHGFKIMVYDA